MEHLERYSGQSLPPDERLREPRQKFTCSIGQIDNLVTKEDLGGKGFHLCQMVELGLSVPRGFIIKTNAWKDYQAANRVISAGITSEIEEQLRVLEETTGRNFGDCEQPLFVSVRSGAPVSMPGCMTTILNVGLSDQTVDALGREIGESSAWESYLNLVTSFGADVFNIEPKKFTYGTPTVCLNELSAEMLKQMVSQAKQVIFTAGYSFPQDPYEQLYMAFATILNSWDCEDARQYRHQHGISDDLGTAAVIQQMVWGNSVKDGSGSGVMLTRNTQTGKEKPQVAFIPKAQGTRVVGESGTHNTQSIDDLLTPDSVKSQLREIAKLLELYYRYPQDIEFTVDGGRLYVLQTRDVPLQPAALFRFLSQGKDIGTIRPDHAIRMITTAELKCLFIPPLDSVVVAKMRQEGKVITVGIPLSLGNASGRIITSLENAQEQKSEVVLAVNTVTLTMMEDLMDPGKYGHISALIAGNGGIGSHISRIANEIGTRMPIVFGADTTGMTEDTLVTVDGNTGEVFDGRVPRVKDSGTTSILSKEECAEAKSWLQRRLENPWRFTTSEDGIDEYINVASAAYEKARQDFQSPKARVQAVINALVPPEIRVNYTIAKPDDIQGIKARANKILASGKHVTVRTCFNPDPKGKAPWVFFTDPSQIDDFFTNPDYPGKYGGYPRWLTEPALTEVLVGANPKDKLSENEYIRRQHGAWTLTCNKIGRVVLQIQPYTPHLRGHEHIGSENLITCFLHFDPKNPESITGIQVVTGDNLKGEAVAENIAKYTIDHIVLWWTQYDIPKRMAAATAIFSPPDYATPVLEGQTRAFSQWCLVYSMKIDRIDRPDKD